MLAVKDGKVQRNPVSGVKFLAEVKRTRFFNQSELDGIRNHLAEPHWHMVAFAVAGVRRGALLVCSVPCSQKPRVVPWWRPGGVGV